jgi:hypothetical protein
MKSKIFLCAFASPDLFLSKIRFYNQAKSLNFYQGIKIYEKRELSTKTLNVIENYLIKNNRRGYGYWIWKPEIILNFLRQIPENSILQYSDIGCHFNRKGINKLFFYQDMCDKNSILSFQYSDPKIKKINFIYPNYLEYQYTKADLMRYFNLNFNHIYMNTPQVCSGTFFIKKNYINIEFLKNWLKVFENMSLIDDSISVSKNHKNFIEHRHDQSVFSLLCKLNNIFSLSVYENFEWSLDNKGRNWDHLFESPIQARRDLKYLSFYAFKKKIKKLFQIK